MNELQTELTLLDELTKAYKKRILFKKGLEKQINELFNDINKKILDILYERDTTITLALNYVNEQYRLSIGYPFCDSYLEYVGSRTRDITYLIHSFL